MADMSTFVVGSCANQNNTRYAAIYKKGIVNPSIANKDNKKRQGMTIVTRAEMTI
jgi:hypothetical protein